MSKDKCCGNFKMLVCLNSNKNDAKNSSLNDDSYGKKSQQCEHCYWYHTAVNVLTDGPQLENSSALIKLLNELDDDLDIFKKPADEYFVSKLFDKNFALFLKSKMKNKKKQK